MNVLVVIPKYEPDIEKTGAPYFLSLGLMYVSSYLKQKGFDVQNLNLNHYADNKLRTVLQEQPFDAICTGGLFTEIKPIMTVIQTTRDVRPHAKIILGGALASGDPEFALEKVGPDFLVLGEGEATLAHLLGTLRDGLDLKEVKGIAYLKDGTMFKTCGRELISDLDSHPWPDYEGFEYGHYLDHHHEKDTCFETVMDPAKRRIANIITSRNCVAKCTFCYRLMTGGHRVRTIENVMKEVKFLMDQYGVNELNLIDEMFANDKQRIYDFCEGIKPLNVRWQCQLRCGVIDEHVLAVMKDAGCSYIGYGFESASKEVLKSMKKGLHPTQIDNVIRWTLKAGITIQGNYIFGDPAENLGTMEETLRFRRKFPALNLGMFMIIPYPGTVLYHDLKAKGRFENLYDFYINPSSVFQGRPLNMTKMPEDDFDYMCKKVWNEGIVSIAYTKVLGSKHLDKTTSLVSYKCLHCSEMHKDIPITFSAQYAETRFCKKCLQRVHIKKSSVYFDLYAKLRDLYHYAIVTPVLIHPKVYKTCKPLISLFRGSGKIGRLIKLCLKTGRSKVIPKFQTTATTTTLKLQGELVASKA